MPKRTAIVRFIISYISGVLGGLVGGIFAVMIFWSFTLMDAFLFSKLFSSITWLIFLLITHGYVKFEKKICNSILSKLFNYKSALIFITLLTLIVVVLHVSHVDEYNSVTVTWLVLSTCTHFIFYIYIIRSYVIRLLEYCKINFSMAELTTNLKFGILSTFSSILYVLIVSFMFFFDMSGMRW